MLKIVVVTLAFALVGSAYAETAAGDIEERAIAALSEDLMYPEKAKIRDVTSARLQDGTWMTCGYVFPMGPTRRDRQWSFMVKDRPDGQTVTSIANDNNDFMAILDVCWNNGVRVARPDMPSDEVPRLIGG